jgi:hypothetical protein
MLTKRIWEEKGYIYNFVRIMKKHIILLQFAILFICNISNVNAQKDGFSFHYGGTDFYGPQGGGYFFNEIQRSSYKSDIGKFDTSKRYTLLWSSTVKLAYWHRINRKWDVNAGFSFSKVKYPNSIDDKRYFNNQTYGIGTFKESHLTEFDAHINYNIISRVRNIVAPYVYLGATISGHDSYYGACLPMGAGINVGVTTGLYVNWESTFKLALTDNDKDHLQHMLGIVYFVQPMDYYRKLFYASEREVKPAKTTRVRERKPKTLKDFIELDTDKDGIPDAQDRCPTEPGLAIYNGCPDRDGDGIPDYADNCPDVPGLAEFNGCNDKDGDGIPDNIDKCPYESGPANNFGCPTEVDDDIRQRVDNAARAVYFETGKALLKGDSYRQLDIIAQILKENERLYADIEGYTDNVGGDMKNLKLSDDRANVCREYLIKKGIDEDRISATGYGPVQPAASNTSAQGRAQNRRTEVKLRTTKKRM